MYVTLSICFMLCGLLWVIPQACQPPLPRPAPSDVEFVMFVSSKGKTCANSLWDREHVRSEDQVIKRYGKKRDTGGESVIIKPSYCNSNG